MGNLAGQDVSSWIIALVGLLYTYVAIENAIKGNYPTAVIFAGYAFSQVGLWLLSK